MALSSPTTLPVSSLNVGLSASIGGLNAKIAKLTADASKLGGAITTQLAFQAIPPDPVSLSAAITAALTPTSLAASLALLSVNATTASASLLVDLGIVETQLAIVEGLSADLQAGLASGGLVGWSYAGAAGSFGEQLRQSTSRGFAGIAPSAPVSGLVVATNSFASWGSFSEGFETGDSAQTDLGGTTAQARLRRLAALSGGEWNTGVASIAADIDLLLAELRGAKSAIEAQIDLTLGIGLPDPGPIVDVGLSVDLTAALGNIAVSLDIDGAIDLLDAQITATADLIASLNAQLSAGGLSIWSYTGRADGIGPELTTALANGLPDTTDGPAGPAYGVVIVSKSPGAWVDFGRIFKTS